MKKETKQKAKFAMGQQATVLHGGRKGEKGNVVAVNVRGVDVEFQNEDEDGEHTYFMLNYRIK